MSNYPNNTAHVFLALWTRYASTAINWTTAVFLNIQDNRNKFDSLINSRPYLTSNSKDWKNFVRSKNFLFKKQDTEYPQAFPENHPRASHMPAYPQGQLPSWLQDEWKTSLLEALITAYKLRIALGPVQNVVEIKGLRKWLV